MKIKYNTSGDWLLQGPDGKCPFKCGQKHEAGDVVEILKIENEVDLYFLDGTIALGCCISWEIVDEGVSTPSSLITLRSQINSTQDSTDFSPNMQDELRAAPPWSASASSHPLVSVNPNNKNNMDTKTMQAAVDNINKQAAEQYASQAGNYANNIATLQVQRENHAKHLDERIQREQANARALTLKVVTIADVFGVIAPDEAAK